MIMKMSFLVAVSCHAVLAARKFMEFKQVLCTMHHDPELQNKYVDLSFVKEQGSKSRYKVIVKKAVTQSVGPKKLSMYRYPESYALSSEKVMAFVFTSSIDMEMFRMHWHLFYRNANSAPDLRTKWENGKAHFMPSCTLDRKPRDCGIFGYRQGLRKNKGNKMEGYHVRLFVLDGKNLKKYELTQRKQSYGKPCVGVFHLAATYENAHPVSFGSYTFGYNNKTMTVEATAFKILDTAKKDPTTFGVIQVNRRQLAYTFATAVNKQSLIYRTAWEQALKKIQTKNKDKNKFLPIMTVRKTAL